MDGLAVSVAALQTKVDSIDEKLTLFIKTATSPDIGFVSAGLLGMMKSQSDIEHTNIHKRVDDIHANISKRIDDINRDHNERISKLETDIQNKISVDTYEERHHTLSNRVWGLLITVVAVLGGLVTDLVMHVTGKIP